LFQTRRYLITLLFNITSKYVISKVKYNQVALKLNGNHELLAYAVYVNLLGDNIDAMERITRPLTDASTEVSLEINVEKYK
jgi:hypothetical protein